MFCPSCNSQLPDGSKACPVCGTSFIQQQPTTDELKEPFIPPNRQETASQKAASKEYSKIKGDFIAYILFAIFSIIAMFVMFFAEKFLYGFIAAALCITFIVLSTKAKERENHLKQISNGAKVSYLCPRCKSSNIQMQMVAANNVSFHGNTTIGENINPLRPFTHINVQQGPTITNTNYANKCHCMSCGFVFDKPEAIYQ